MSAVGTRLSQIGRFITDKDTRFNYLCILGAYNKMSDEKFLKMKYKRKLGIEPDLDNPLTYNEKCQWLKLHDRNPIYTDIVDKYKVKQFVADKIGEEYVVPLLGVYNNFDDINFDELPDQFVLKCTHDSGGFAICRSKKEFDIAAAKKRLESRLKRNFYIFSREWPYKNVKPRIIAENYIDSLGNKDSVEYKLTCFNGKVKMTTVCGGIAHSTFDNRTNDFYDRDGNIMPFYVFYKNSETPLPLPNNIEQIITLSEILAKDIPQVRVDWYMHNGHLYFGEMTFYTWGGYCVFTPKEWDRKLGDWIELPR